MTEGLMVLKALGDDMRLKLCQALAEQESYAELLSQRLEISAATVSFHMKKLIAAGLVKARREQYYTMYTLNAEAFDATLRQLALDKGERDEGQQAREEQYRRKVLKAFMPCGYCAVLPAQIKKRMIIYDEIYARFTPGEAYAEKDVNRIIEQIHEDYCAVRRAFIGLGWMRRENGVYTVLAREPGQ